MPVLIREPADEFYLYLEAERGCSPLTVQAYRSDIEQFCEFLKDEEVLLQVGAVTPKLLRRFLLAMKQAGLAASTRGRRLYALRSLWDFLEKAEMVEANPCRKVSAPKTRQSVPECLTPVEFARQTSEGEAPRCVGFSLRRPKCGWLRPTKAGRATPSLRPHSVTEAATLSL